MNNRIVINEGVDELKGIPQGKEFSKRPSGWKNDDDWDGFIYKVIESRHAESFADVYHRKKSDGWEGGKDCYGIVGYTHLLLKGAMRLLSYGGTIVKMKLLGGLQNYVFFDADRDPDIKKALIDTYGSNLSVEEQIFAITGDRQVARDFAWTDSGRFGTKWDKWSRRWNQGDGEKIMRRTGKIIRGFVCEYGYNDAMVAPFVFSDMVTCAVAHNVRSNEPIESVRAKFVGTLDQNRRVLQDNYVDLVPHLYAVDAVDVDSDEGARIGDKLYVQYTSKRGEHNMLVIDEHNWGSPKDTKLFPSEVKLDDGLANPSRKGSFMFSMNGQQYIANVCGLMSNGQKAKNENGAEIDFPIFAIRGCEEEGWWFPMDRDTLIWVYQNPEWAKQMKEQYYSSNDYGQVGEGVKTHREIISEAFEPGMTYDDFVKSNVGKDNENIMYVCTHCYFVEGIMQKGFSRAYANVNDKDDNGGALTYGDGVYGTPSIKNAANNLSQKTADIRKKPDGYKYGNVILKCILMGGWKGFLIFDGNFARKIYGDKWQVMDQIDLIVKDRAANAELKNYVQPYLRMELYDPRNDSLGRTNHIIFNMFNNGWSAEQRKSGIEKWTNFFRKNGIRGAVYHGHGDRFCSVCYDYSEVVPFAISYDYGQTWTTKGNSWTLSNGKTYKTNGVDWQALHDRLISAGDPIGKLGAEYNDVSLDTQEVRFGPYAAGLASVQCKNGKYNFVTMQDIRGNDGKLLYKKYSKIFPVDFDEKASISLRGTINFIYKGVNFRGKVYDEEANGPVILIPKKTVNGIVEERFEMQYLDWFAENYEAYVRGDFDADNGEYEEQDTTTNQQLQEEFFKALDRIEGV